MIRTTTTVYTGLDSDKTTITPNAGDVYVSTDTHGVYVYKTSPSNWVAMHEPAFRHTWQRILWEGKH